MTVQDRKRLDNRQQSLAMLLEDLNSGAINPEDLDDDILRKLQELLLKK